MRIARDASAVDYLAFGNLWRAQQQRWCPLLLLSESVLATDTHFDRYGRQPEPRALRVPPLDVFPIEDRRAFSSHVGPDDKAQALAKPAQRTPRASWVRERQHRFRGGTVN